MSPWLAQQLARTVFGFILITAFLGAAVLAYLVCLFLISLSRVVFRKQKMKWPSPGTFGFWALVSGVAWLIGTVCSIYVLGVR